MIRLQHLHIAFLFVFITPLAAQQDFYQPENISEIRLYFSQNNWQHQLDSIFIASGGEGRMLANVVIDGKLYPKAGVRYKGFSSWNEGELKNPFNIELDYTVKNLNHLGFTKIKLSNVIHDPSFVREVLAYEIVRKYMPASRSGYARLYINDAFIGLYTNNESVDKILIYRYFNSNKGSFIKGEPEELQFPFGQNANLAHTHGDDSLNYIPYYKLESDFGWSDLYQFIYTLNEDTSAIESVLNVDQALWMHALNYTLVNLDSYIGYSQNYYLYRDISGRFNPIIWDLNMSFGSFRSSDGSTHFQGLTIPELKTLDPLQHLDFSISPRPLMTRLFENATRRKMYLAHMRTILDENIRNNWYFNRGKALQDIIRSTVMEDTNKFYSDTDFENNLTTTVGGTSGMILYPGLQDLMTARLQYLDTYPGFAGAPDISEIKNYPELAEKGKECAVTARVESTSQVTLYYRNTRSDIFQEIPMVDDGDHMDGTAGDHVFGAKVIPESCDFQYYIYAENDSAGRFSPERASFECYHLRPSPVKGDIHINEIQTADNQDNWIEILNNQNEDISLQGCFLSVDPNLPFYWTFPDTLLPSHSFLMVHLNHTDDTLMQCNLYFSPLGAELYFINCQGKLIDKVNYPLQIAGKTYGRYPNGYGPFTFMKPTYSRNNLPGSTPATAFTCYPSPASSVITVEFEQIPGITLIDIYNGQGQKVIERSSFLESSDHFSQMLTINIATLASGIYIIQLQDSEGTAYNRFFKI